MTTLYRGLDEDLPIASLDAMTFFAAGEDGWDLAWSYTFGAPDGIVYRAEMLPDAIRGEHDDFAEELACAEGGDWHAELLEEMGADYFIHTEAGVTTIGVRTDRLSHVLADVAVQDKACDWDEWRPSSDPATHKTV